MSLSSLLAHQRGFHSRVISSALNLRATGSTLVPYGAAINYQSRSVISLLFNPTLKRLEEQADANPTDANAQALLLKEYQRTQSPDKVKARYESGKYATNEEVTKEYITALVRLNMFDRVQLNSLISSNTLPAEVITHLKQHNSSQTPILAPAPVNTQHSQNAGQGPAIPAGTVLAAGEITEQTTRTTTTTTTQQAPGFATVAAAPAISPVASSQPLNVTLVMTPAQRAWAVVRTVGLLGAFGYLLYLLQGSGEEETKKTVNFPVGNAHSLVKTVSERFDDVKGVDEAKSELQEVVEYLKNPGRFAKLGAKLPKGVLLVGPPGTGKTLLARAIAGEAGVPFFYCSGSSFDELFVGVGASRIRKLFDDAKAVSPCIIFIDEIDALGAARRYNMTSSSKETTLNQLLTEMDGFQQTEGIIVIGATNIPDALDSALTRPGRFDKQVAVPVPDVKGRKELVEYYLKKTVPAKDINPSVIARATPGFTGADIANLINLAAIKATLRNMSAIDMKLLEEAKDDIIMGIKRTTVEKNMDELKVTAYHEGGHALVALLSAGAHPVHKATIIQRGQALGVTVQLPEKDEQSYSRKQMLARLAVCMGGRAAEELVFGDLEVTSGASSDLKSATMLASNMVKRWGMSEKAGLVFYKNDDSLKPASDVQRTMLDEEIKRLLQESYDKAKHILSTHRRELDLIANALLEHETLSGEEIKLLVEGKRLPNKEQPPSPSSPGSNGENGAKGRQQQQPANPPPKLDPAAVVRESASN